MPPVPRDRFRAALGELDADALAVFVADLWRATGAKVRRDGRTVAVERGGETRTLVAVPDAGSVPPDGWDVMVCARQPVDDVPGGETAGLPGAETVGPDELWRRTMYAVEPSAGAALLDDHLGLPRTVGDGRGGAGERGTDRERASATQRGRGSTNRTPRAHEHESAERDRERANAAQPDRERANAAQPDRERANAAQPDHERGDVSTSGRGGESVQGKGGEGTSGGVVGRGTTADDDGRATPDDGASRGSSLTEFVGGRRRFTALALVLAVLVPLLVAAALGGWPGSAGEPAAPNGTPTLDTAVHTGATPAAQVTEEPPRDLAADPTRVPGLTENGIINAGQVAKAHVEALDGRSYTLVLTYREYDRGSPTGFRREVVEVAASTVYRTRVRTSGDLLGDPRLLATGTAYADGTHRFVRTDDGVVRENVSTTPGWHSIYAARTRPLLESLLRANRSFVIDTARRGNVTYYWLRLEGLPDGRTASGTALVDSRGIVHQVQRRYEHARGDRRAVISIQLVALGETTVTAPTWVDRADDSTPTATPNATPTATPNATPTATPNATPTATWSGTATQTPNGQG